MKKTEIKIEYVVKSDIVQMLKTVIKEIENSDHLLYLDIVSNCGGSLTLKSKDYPLPDLRKKGNFY